ncbi:MAG: GntR family transcriptional regulator [Caldimonas sp.]
MSTRRSARIEADVRSAAPTSFFKPIAPDSAGMPLYRAVKQAVLAAIEAGAFPPGAALPSEAELARSFRVSIGTLRKAIDELGAEHIIVRRQGRGTFVATHTQGRFLFQFFHVERSDGLREHPQVDLVSFERSRADDVAAAALQVRPGEPVIEIENRLRLQGRAVVHDRIVVVARLFKGLTEKRLGDRTGTIYQLYQSAFGISVIRAVERSRAGPSPAATCRVLGIPPGLAVLHVHRTALTFGDRPVEYRHSIIDTTRHEYVNLLARPARGIGTAVQPVG